MQITLAYPELQCLIANRFGKNVGLECVSENTLCASYKMKVLIVEKTMRINLTVERIEENDVFLSYDGGVGINYIMKGLLKIISQPEIDKMVEEVDNNRLVVHLNRIEKLAKPLQIYQPHRIWFDEQNVTVEAEFKQLSN